MKYKFLEHTADVKFQAFGNSLEEAFENSAYAMCSLMVDSSKVKAAYTEEIAVEGKDKSALLYNFLEEILFLLDAKGFILSGVKNIKIEEGKLSATLAGDIELDQYELGADVKAVTYNEMNVEQSAEGWMCQVVLDL